MASKLSGSTLSHNNSLFLLLRFVARLALQVEAERDDLDRALAEAQGEAAAKTEFFAQERGVLTEALRETEKRLTAAEAEVASLRDANHTLEESRIDARRFPRFAFWVPCCGPASGPGGSVRDPRIFF